MRKLAFVVALVFTFLSLPVLGQVKPRGGPVTGPALLTQSFCISTDGEAVCHCGAGKLCSAGDNGCACLTPPS